DAENSESQSSPVLTLLLHYTNGSNASFCVSGKYGTLKKAEELMRVDTLPLDEKAGCCSNTVEVRVLRFKIGRELMSVDILFLKKFLLRFDYRTKLNLEAFLEDWEPTKDSFLVVRALGMSLLKILLTETKLHG
ncbi:hypothetical protein IGI04_000917, partial [Brassica rapa subsp. trilocularis]